MSQDTQWNYEVIVIDNLSKEMEGIRERFNKCIWIDSEVKNPYVSRNKGIALSRGDFIGLLDAKCIPRHDWIEQGMSRILKAGNDLVAGAYEVIPASERLKDNIYGLLYLNNQKNTERRFGVTAGNLFIKKEIFPEIGLFPDDYLSGNDIAWTKSALEKGCSIVYEPNMYVTYPGQSFELLKQKVKKYAAGIRHQQSGIERVTTLIKMFFPMRIETFRTALKYRRLEGLSIFNKYYLWFLIWSVKLRMAWAYLFHR